MTPTTWEDITARIQATKCAFDVLQWPRGKEMPAALPKTYHKNESQTKMLPTTVLNVRGHRVVNLAPKALNSITISRSDAALARKKRMAAI